MYSEMYEMGREVFVQFSKWMAIQENLDLKDVLPL